MASPIRIKDISRTVTTASANEYLAVDGPSGSGKMLTPDPRGTATLAAAAAVAGAYGSAPVFTTAQLLALTAGNRPPVAYCSDCLVPEGVGSPVVWSGTAWVSTCSGIPATTDALTYFRALVVAGKDYFASGGVFKRVASFPYGMSPSVSGTGAARGILGDGESMSYTTGSLSNGYAANTSTFIDCYALAAGSPRKLSSIYYTTEIYVNAASSVAQSYSLHHALISYGGSPAAITADAIGLYYDPQNNLVVGSGGSGNWLAITRSGSVQTLVDTNSAAAVTSFSTRSKLEIIASASDVRFIINGAQVASITTNIPLTQLRPSTCIAKANGVTPITMVLARTFTGCNYSA